jgi:hypothetical protein
MNFNRGKILRNKLIMMEQIKTACAQPGFPAIRSGLDETNFPKTMMGFIAVPKPNWESSIAYRINVESSIAIALQQAALELYRLKNNHYPEKLEELVPDYLVALPLDPFTGQKFLTWMKEDRMYVYTPGPDNQDTHMEVLYDPSNGTMSMGNFGSIPYKAILKH